MKYLDMVYLNNNCLLMKIEIEISIKQYNLVPKGLLKNLTT